jgi:hypothetical protein
LNTHTEIVEKYKKQISSILNSDDWDIRIYDYNVSFSEKFEAGEYRLILNNQLVSTFELIPMINCCGILVSTRSIVYDKFKNKGIGTILNSFRIDIARAMGYSLLLCTDVDNNDYQQKILLRNGWKNIFSFINQRTSNKVNIHVINL